MLFHYLLFFLSFTVYSQTKTEFKVIPNPQTLEDFEHQHRGCPENSECDQVMGIQLKRWKDMVTKLKSDDISPDKKAQFVELFRGKYGIPVEFYTNLKSQLGFKPLYFNSHCKEHNPKILDQKILKGTAFVKSITKDKAIIWRDQTQIEVPTKDLLMPQTVTVYFPEGEKDYYLPLTDQPLFVKDKELMVLKEEDEFFYILKVSPLGEWKVISLDFSKLSEWENKKEYVECPTEAAKAAPGPFGTTFCKTIWDEDSKKLVVAKMQLGCPI